MSGSVMESDAWTNERLDDLNNRVIRIDERMEGGFREMREEFKALRGEMQGEFKALRGEMQGELKASHGRMWEELKALRGDMREELKASHGGMQEELKALRGDMREELKASHGGMQDDMQGIRADIQALNNNFAAQQRTMVQFAGAMVAAYIGGTLGLIAAIVTAL